MLRLRRCAEVRPPLFYGAAFAQPTGGKDDGSFGLRRNRRAGGRGGFPVGCATAASAATGFRASAAGAAGVNRTATAIPALSDESAEGARPELPSGRARAAGGPIAPQSQSDEAPREGDAPPCESTSQREAGPSLGPRLFLEADDPAVPRDELQADHGAQILPDDDEAGPRHGGAQAASCRAASPLREESKHASPSPLM